MPAENAATSSRSPCEGAKGERRQKQAMTWQLGVWEAWVPQKASDLGVAHDL